MIINMMSNTTQLKPLSVYVFVYGTLKQGYYNNVYLQNDHSQFIKNTTVRGYEMYKSNNLSYPFVLPKDNAKIEGELWRVTSNKVISHLDILEGVPNLYTRELIKTDTGEDAYIYIGNPKVFLDTSNPITNF
ncbi:MAG: gamma-glutamylcyclotransferase family protein [Fusobacteriaceae bacterium]